METITHENEWNHWCLKYDVFVSSLDEYAIRPGDVYTLFTDDMKSAFDAGHFDRISYQMSPGYITNEGVKFEFYVLPGWADVSCVLKEDFENVDWEQVSSDFVDSFEVAGTEYFHDINVDVNCRRK